MFGENEWTKIIMKKVWRMNRSAEMLSIVTTNLDGFSLANLPNFFPRQTFPLYSKPVGHEL